MQKKTLANRKRRLRLFSSLSIIILMTIITGCDKNTFTLPRLSFEEPEQGRFPILVSYAFDRNLLQATLPIEGCNQPYTIPSGKIITDTFIEESKPRFAGVTTLPESGQASPATGANSLTIRLSLVNQAFVPTDRIGDEDRYLAVVNLQLLAVYVDPQGKELAQTPLQYSTRASMWTPALTSSSASCATGQFDAEIRKAASRLVDDMVSAIPQLVGPQTGPPSQAQQPAPLPGSARAISVLTFRSMLEDANNDLILDGGEMVILKLETTNTGSALLSNIEINLSGSQDLVTAFTSSIDFPVNIGQLQPGESRVTEIRGRVPHITEKTRGELVISARAPDVQAPRTHRILASMQPGQNQAGAMAPAKGLSQEPKPGGIPGLPYLAILVGVNTYSDPWPGTQSAFLGQLQPLTDALEVTGVFTGEYAQKLQNSGATKAALEDALFSWGRQRVDTNSVLLFYFYGQALAHTSTGEVYLLPYDSSPNGSSKSLIPLQVLQKALARLKTRATLFFLDAPLIQAPAGKTMTRINWTGGIPNGSASGKNSLIQIRHRNPTQQGDSARMLAGLFGRADRNNDRTITIGELLEDLKGIAEITPGIPSMTSEVEIPLTR